MKIKSSTIVFILAILFILIGGLSYFFYIKYQTSMNYINEQFTTYNLHIQKQLSNIMEQYQSYISYKNKNLTPSYEKSMESDMIIGNPPYNLEKDYEFNEEQESVINQLHKELKTIQEEDLGYKSDDEELILYSSEEEQIEDCEEKDCEEEETKNCEDGVCLIKKVDEEMVDNILQQLEKEKEVLPTLSSDEESIDININF